MLVSGKSCYYYCTDLCWFKAMQPLTGRKSNTHDKCVSNKKSLYSWNWQPVTKLSQQLTVLVVKEWSRVVCFTGEFSSKIFLYINLNSFCLIITKVCTWPNSSAVGARAKYFDIWASFLLQENIFAKFQEIKKWIPDSSWTISQSHLYIGCLWWHLIRLSSH